MNRQESAHEKQPGVPLRATPIVALDFWMPDAAMQMVDLLGDRCDFYKVGSELFTVAGPTIVRQLIEHGKRVFLDLKLHDIPNTVEKAVAAAAALGASIVTVHASGGERMIHAAVGNAGSDCEVFAVTVLTSLTGDELGRLWGGDPRLDDVSEDVMRLAVLAKHAGVAGVVCSGLEAPVLRDRLGATIKLLVPGVRLPGADRGDQSRVVSPAEAARAGASYVVLGRTVTSATDPEKAMDEAVASLT
ncbi:MAG: orotidine-5'-phosphate decarboxylase [Gemmatimonadota bacterium]|nr:orotidine-5'-phosphate decarboxylase [Gemmatimonadota bacterium]